MPTLLLLVIFITYIGLGIPDSLFGTAWPGIYTEFGVSVSLASWVTLLISLCTMIASLFSARLVRRFGTARVTAFSTLMTALALWGFSHAPDLWMMCLLAIPLGMGGGAVDTALNSYVALHYRASHINFLHCCYGVGVTVSPYLMSLALRQGPWRMGYRWAFLVQAAIAVVAIAAIPLWAKVHPGVQAEEEASSASLPWRKLLRIPLLPVVWVMLFCSCSLEYSCGIWASSFLVEARGMTADMAAVGGMVYYLGMALGRFLSGILTNRYSPWRVMCWGEAVAAAAVITLLLPLPGWAAMAALFLVGLGNGPFYPNITYLTPDIFGRDNTAAIMGTMTTAAYIGIMLMPTLLGAVARLLGLGALPGYAAVLMAGLAASTLWLVHRRKYASTIDEAG